MTEQIKESLSVLMDEEANELDIERVLKNSTDAELRSTWTRYHAVRQVLREGSGRHLQVDIASRVMSALEDEPKMRPAAGIPAAGTPVAGIPVAGTPAAGWHTLLRPVASLAVAASVFASVLVGSQFYGLLDVEAGATAELAAQVSTVGMVNTLGGSAVRAGYASPALRARTAPRYADYDQLARQRLQRYLLTHAEEAALNAPQGMMPYARVASFQGQD